ncbi:YecA family protein [Clostridium saccharobutylicum]|uniref:YecA family protein n=1 Tax=Clostridium saccharobutylicum TaxID=169679 RepID=UPI003BFA70A1
MALKEQDKELTSKVIEFDKKETHQCGICGEDAICFNTDNNIWLCEKCNDIQDGMDKFAEKMEKKLSKRVYSFDINELLNCLSKDEIYNIARNLGANKISNLAKGKLIEKLNSEYKDLIEQRLYLFEEERYKILKSYVDNEGIKNFDDIDEEEANKSAYFIQQGFLFPTVKDEQSLFLMPKLVQDLVKEKNNIEYRRLLKNNGEIINIYRGMNQAYGILEIDDSKKILARYQNIEELQLEELLRESAYYYNEYREEGKLFVNNQIEDYEGFVDEINANKDLEYIHISKEELLNMSEENWVYNTKAGKSFYKEFTSVFSVDKDMTIAMMEDLALDIQDNEPKEAVDQMLELINIENEQVRFVAAGMMTKFVNKLGLWKYKGASINDMKASEVSSKQNKPIGRNDLCICGSGKKYKKCCGRNGNIIPIA